MIVHSIVKQNEFKRIESIDKMMLSKHFDANYKHMDRAAMKKFDDYLKSETDAIRSQLTELPPFAIVNNLRQHASRITLERCYADACIQREEIRIYNKSLRGDLFAKRRKLRALMKVSSMERQENFCYQNSDFPPLPGAAVTSSTNRLHLLPDLVILNIIGHFQKRKDVRSFFATLHETQHESLEYEFCQRIEECSSDTMNVDAKSIFRSCSDEVCGDATICSRCYLNQRTKCSTCRQIVFDSGDSEFSVPVCDNFVAPGQRCCDMRTCKRCDYKYHVSKETVVLKTCDFECFCWASGEERLGCLNCLIECDQCANFGCKVDHHFQRLSAVADKSQWPVCDQCKHQHCCRVRTRDNLEWDYCVCPLFY